MARKVKTEDYSLDVRKPTQPGHQADPAGAEHADLREGRIISAGVGIREGENAALEALAERYDTTKNSLMRLAIRLFIVGVRDGSINLDNYFEEPERPKKRLKLD